MKLELVKVYDGNGDVGYAVRRRTFFGRSYYLDLSTKAVGWHRGGPFFCDKCLTKDIKVARERMTTEEVIE